MKQLVGIALLLLPLAAWFAWHFELLYLGIIFAVAWLGALAYYFFSPR
jgi:hypothetical protein